MLAVRNHDPLSMYPNSQFVSKFPVVAGTATPTAEILETGLCPEIQIQTGTISVDMLVSTADMGAP